MDLGDEFLEEFYNNITQVENIEGWSLSVAAINNTVYEHMMEFGWTNTRKVKFVSGLCYELLMCLQQSLKFRYYPRYAKSWIGGNQTFMTGLAADVIYRKADLAISQASMVMLQQPLPRISYLLPTSHAKLTAVFRQPSAHNMRDIVVPSFNSSIWMSWAFTWVTIIISLKVIQYVIRRAPSSEGSLLTSEEQISEFGPDNSLTGYDDNVTDENSTAKLEVSTWCFSTITCQDWDNRQTSISIRALMLISIVFADLMCIYYSAALTSILANEEIPIASMRELTKSKLKVYGDSSLPVVRDIVHDIYESRKKGVNISMSKKNSEYLAYVDHARPKILNESGAFITFDDMVRKIFDGSKQNESKYFCAVISSLSVNSGHLPNAMFVRQGSKLKEIFNRKILVMQERGLTYRINLAYSSKTIITCPKISHQYRGGLAFEDLSTAFLFVVFGVLVSFVGLLAEKSGLLKLLTCT